MCNVPDKRILLGALYDTYGPLLSEKQQLVLDYYYNDDLSLSEIAQNIGITRQGVRDLLIHGEEQLYFFEEKLGIYARNEKIGETAKQIAALTDDGRIKALAASLSER
ncbi:MAG TPA: sigma factor-like helix-turn-helix DNA-binding protein [Bacillota bacterium]|nr:sigma factor-like helix-turn-helix DNA-binding protein [Bacillota bacterium]